MKVIHLFLVGLISVCCTKTETHLGTLKHECVDRDSLLVSFLLTQFEPFHYDQSSIKRQLKSLRSGNPNSTSSRSLNASFENFHFQSFRFDSQSHMPFAVQITDDEDNLLFLFTFTDEIYYNYNNLSASFISDCFTLDSLSSVDSAFFQNVNLERNLNAMIKKLKLERYRGATLKVIDLIFRKLLEMETYEDSEIAMIVELIEQKYGEPKIVELICAEYNQFNDRATDGVLRFKSYKGFSGYWSIWTERLEGVNTVKAKFFSDVLFTQIDL